MVLITLPHRLTVCKLAGTDQIDLRLPFFFAGRTADEVSLVCPEEDVPAGALRREDGWRALRVEGVLDFSLVGILSEITAVLAENGVGLFAVSTFDTDYILVKEKDLARAKEALSRAGHRIKDDPMEQG